MTRWPRGNLRDEAFARKFNLGHDVVGTHMSRGSDTRDIEIVGLVKDAKYQSAKQKTPPVFYVP